MDETDTDCMECYEVVSDGCDMARPRARPLPLGALCLAGVTWFLLRRRQA